MATPPVDENEVLFRQIGAGGDPVHFDATRRTPVYRSVFLPSTADGDGLSLLRPKCRSKIWCAFRVEQPAARFRLASLQASNLRQIATEVAIDNFELSPSKDRLDEQHGEPWAHCVATKINRSDYDSDKVAKARMKEWAIEVSDSINASQVQGPFSEPTENDPYRPT